jgi:predicted acyltransferase
MALTLPLADPGTMTAEHNLGASIDQRVFGRHLLYPLWDPEGLLSTAPAVVTALCGVFAGGWLKRPRSPHRTRWLCIGGAIAVLVGLAWDRVFPINKQLWTSSFALFTAGMAALVLAACDWLLEIGPRLWSVPFIALGRNALAGYFLSVGLDSILTHWHVGEGGSLKNFLYETVFDSSIGRCCGGEAASLGYALTYLVLWTVVLGEMHRRRIFVAI